MEWRAQVRAIELIAESNIMDISLHDVPYILPHKKEALSTAGLVVHHNSRQVAYYDLFQRLGGVSSIDIYIRYMALPPTSLLPFCLIDVDVDGYWTRPERPASPDLCSRTLTSQTGTVVTGQVISSCPTASCNYIPGLDQPYIRRVLT